MRRLPVLSALAATWIVLVSAPADAGGWRHGYWRYGGWDYRNWGYGAGRWGFGIAAASPWWGYDGYQPVYGQSYPYGYAYGYPDGYSYSGHCAPASLCNTPYGGY